MNRNSHTHELFYRTVNRDGTCSLTRFAAHVFSDSNARADLISLAEGVAKHSKTLSAKRDGIVYKVDGKCEFFVSRYFYLWPSGSGFEENHTRESAS